MRGSEFCEVDLPLYGVLRRSPGGLRQEGQVTGTEVGDEEGYYEVEVTSDDGSQADVHLDRDFKVLSTSADVESPDDKDEPNDD